MGDLSNYDVYKIGGLPIDGYMFSVQEENEEEPTYKYYIVTLDQNKKAIITRLNNTIELINTTNLQLIPIDIESPEIQNFISLVQASLKSTAIVPQAINAQTLKLTKI